jgi:hypothetical protein
MQQGSLLECIKGFPNPQYPAPVVGDIVTHDGPSRVYEDSIYLVEYPPYKGIWFSFTATHFREIQLPMTIDIEELQTNSLCIAER